VKNFTINKPLKNFIYLLILQISNYIIPIVTFPYITRILGSEKIGIIAFSTSFISYFQIITDFGFNYSATREIALHKNDKNKLIEIFNTVISIKQFLLILLFFIYLFIILFSQKFNVYISFYLLSYGLVISQTLFPIWFFQGMEDMGKITLFNLASKLLFFILTINFIKEPSDFIFVPLFNTFGNLLIVYLSFWYINKYYNIKFNFVFNYGNILKYLRSGWNFFLVNISSNIYTYFTTFILGFYITDSQLGIYSVADKVLSIFKSIISPFFQAYYPVFVRYSNIDKNILLKKVKMLFLIISILLFFVVGFSYIFSDYFFITVFGKGYLESSKIFKILIFNILIIGLLSINTNLILSAFGFTKILSKLIFISSLIHITILIVFFSFGFNKILVASYSTIFTELIILLASTFFVRKYIFKNDVN
jgi:PST family polysaccharide transporter